MAYLECVQLMSSSHRVCNTINNMTTQLCYEYILTLEKGVDRKTDDFSAEAKWK